MISLPGPTGWAPSSTSRDARSGGRPQHVEATVVEAPEREDWWAVRVEIVKSRPPAAAPAPASARVMRPRVAVDAPPAARTHDQASDEHSASAAMVGRAETALAAPGGFDVPDLRRAIAAYGAQSSARDIASSEATGPRLRIRA
jgi:hypothetical protein